MQAGGKVALVTGAGSGIGRAVVLLFLAQGWSVVLAGRDREKLDATARMAGQDTSRALAVETDIRDPQSVTDLFDGCVEWFGRLDVLFNNAGVSPPAASVADCTLDDWRLAVDTNVTGAFLCAQAAMRVMRTQSPKGGRIINNGSIAAQSPRPLSGAYTVSKHAITGLTRSIALDGRADDIACGQIDIGNAATELLSGIYASAAAKGQATDPVMDVEHAARSVLHMASLPLDANVLFMTVMATKMPFVGRG